MKDGFIKLDGQDKPRNIFYEGQSKINEPYFRKFESSKMDMYLKTYAAISNAHLSRIWKRVKLSGSCLSTINGFGSTELFDILMLYWCFRHFLDKIK